MVLGLNECFLLVRLIFYCNESIMSKRLHPEAEDSRLSTPFFAARTLITQNVRFTVRLEVPASLRLPVDPHC